MSERVLKTRLSLDGEKQFKQGLKSVNSELSVLKSEYKTLMTAFDAGDKSIETITKLHENLAAQVAANQSKVDGLKDAVEKSNETFEAAKQKLADAQRKYEETAAAQGKNSDAAKEAEKEMRKAENAAKSAGNHYDDYRKQLAYAESALVSSNQALERFERTQNGEISALQKLGDAFKSLGEQIGNLTKKAAELSFKAAETSAKAFVEVTETGFKAGLKAVETYAKTFAKAAETVGKFAFSVGSDFEAQMSTVSSISGATGEELERLSAKASEMGATTSFSATESAKALEYMAMAGWKTQDMENGLQGIVYLAQASGEELATVSDIVTDSMTAFGMSADQSEYFANVLAKTASNANTNVGMMGETFQYVAPLAGALGYSIEDMSAAIGLMANAGIKGSMSGTALRNIITNLATPTDDVAEAMETLGIALTNEDGTMKSFRETLDSMRAGFANLSEVEKAQYASTIAGQRGMSGLLAIVNSSDEDFMKLTEAIHDCDGAAEEMSKIRLDNLAGDITLFKSALEGAGKKIYDEISVNLRGIVQDGNKIIDAFNEHGIMSALDKFKEIFNKNLVEIEKNFSRIAPQIFGTFNKIIVTGAEMLVSAMPLITQKIIPALITGTKTLVLDFVDMLPTFVPQLADGAVTLFNGIFDGLNEVTERLIKYLPKITRDLIDRFIKNAPEMFDKSLEFFANVGEALAVAAGQLIPKIPQIISGFIKTLTSKENIQRFKNVGKEFIINLASGFSGDNSAFKTVTANITKGFSNIFGAFENINLSRLSESFGGILESLSPIIEKIGGLFEWLSENVLAPFIEWAGNEILPNLFDGLAAAVDLLSGALGFLETPAKAVWEFLQPVINGAGDVIAGTIDIFSDAFQGLADKLDGIDWEGYWLDIGNFWENVSVGADDISQSLLDSEEDINDFFNTTALGESWNNFWQGVGEVVADVVAAVKNKINETKEKFDNFKAFVSDCFRTVKDDFESLKNKFTLGFEIIKTAVNTAVNYFSDKVNEWLDGIENIKNTFSGLIDIAWNWGTDIIDNFIGGLKSKWDEWTDTWEEFGGFIYDLLHHSTPEKGLLKDDDKWMPDMMDNLIHGITSKQSELQHTISDTAEIIGGLNDNSIITPEISFEGLQDDLKAEISISAENIELPEIPDITRKIRTVSDKLETPEIPDLTRKIRTISDKLETPEIPDLTRKIRTVSDKLETPEIPDLTRKIRTVSDKLETPEIPDVTRKIRTVSDKLETPEIPDITRKIRTVSDKLETPKIPDITAKIKTAFEKIQSPEIPEITAKIKGIFQELPEIPAQDMSLPFMQAGEIFRSSQNNYNTSNYDNRTVYAPVNVSINANINNDTDIRTIAQGIARETQKNLAGIGVYEE